MGANRVFTGKPVVSGSHGSAVEEGLDGKECMHKRRYRYCIEKAFLALYRGRKEKKKKNGGEGGKNGEEKEKRETSRYLLTG